MSATSSNRRGLLAGGNWIVDHVKLIDGFPQPESLANIQAQHTGPGGAPCNVLLDLARSGVKFPLLAAGLVGKDDAGAAILADCKRHKIDTKHLGTTTKAATSFTDVMTEQATGRRTFFHSRGANALWTGDDLDFRRLKVKHFHLGYLLLLDALDTEDARFGTGAARLLARAVEWIRESKRPLIIAGGGVLYSEASAALAKFATQTGIPVGETQAGKGSLPYDHPQNMGAVGVTGTFAANRIAREADLVIGIGTRYSDFTTASKTAFHNPKVRFININVAEFDAFKHSALPLVADARAAITTLGRAVGNWRVSPSYCHKVEALNRAWDREVSRLYTTPTGRPVSQAEVVGAVNEFARPQDVVMGAAGSVPGDLHRLWRTRDPKGYHLEYGYSCMGYEVAGGLGIKLAAPNREVYVMVGDGSWLMMSSELVTAVQEGVKLTIVLLNNHGFQSIGGLSQAIGNGRFGVRYKFRNPKTGHLDGANVPVDFAANARSLGAHVIAARDIPELKAALAEARRQTRSTVIVIETDAEKRAPGYDSWWDVPIAEVSEMASVRKARKAFAQAVKKEKYFL